MMGTSDAVDRDQARAIADEPAVKDCLFLVNKGVPFDVAFTLDATMRLAWCVVLGELDGGRFDWTRLEWDKRDA